MTKRKRSLELKTLAHVDDLLVALEQDTDESGKDAVARVLRYVSEKRGFDLALIGTTSEPVPE